MENNWNLDWDLNFLANHYWTRDESAWSRTIENIVFTVFLEQLGIIDFQLVPDIKDMHFLFYLF